MMRRIIMVVTVALVMAAMMLAMAMPAFAGNAFAKGQNDTNFGAFQDETGDIANNKCFEQGRCVPGEGRSGGGTANN
jgi:hypothetical protein